MTLVRAIFVAAALFNLAVGLALMLATEAFGAAIGVDYPPEALLAARMAGLLIAVFGVGYGFVAARPASNRDLVRLGIVGKASFIGFAVAHAAAGIIPFGALTIVGGDAIFVALFAFALGRLPPPAA